MKQILKIELERAYKNKAFLVALIIGAMLSFANVIIEVIPRAMNPLRTFSRDGQILPQNVFVSWMGGNQNFEYTLLIRIIPLLVVIPYAATYFSDKKNGIIKNYYVRMDKKNYLIAKYITVFFSAGIVAIFPFVLNLMITSMILPSIRPEVASSQGLSVNGLWSQIYYTHPYAYILLSLMLIFMLSGIFGSMTLMLSHFANNRFIAMVFPFLLTTCTNMLFSNSRNWFIRGFTTSRILDMTQIGPNYGVSILIEMISLFALTFTIFVLKGVRDDTF